MNWKEQLLLAGLIVVAILVAEAIKAAATQTVTKEVGDTDVTTTVLKGKNA